MCLAVSLRSSQINYNVYVCLNQLNSERLNDCISFTHTKQSYFPLQCSASDTELHAGICLRSNAALYVLKFDLFWVDRTVIP